MRTVPTFTASPRSRWVNGAYFAFLACYLAGLMLWLILGLLPTVTFAVPALTRELTSLAAGDGPFADIASAVVTNRSMMPSGGSVAVEYLFSVLNLALGLIITWRRPHGIVPRLLALGCLGTAATFNEPSHVVFHLLTHAALVTAVHFTFHIVSGLAYLWAVLLFPDGSLPLSALEERPRATWAGVLAVSGLIVWICYRSSFVSHPPFFVAFFGILVPVVGIAAQSSRLRNPALGPVVRQQSRLLRAALAPALGAAVLWLGAHAIELLGAPGHDGAATFADTVQSGFPAVFAVVPVMLLVAILRYRLWDIDIVVSRTLVYALLAGIVAVAYGAALAVAGWLLGSRIWTTLVAFVVVALVAEPARQKCRRLVNRLVFGAVLTPRESMRSLAEQLTASTATNELAQLAALVVGGTRCVEAEVWLLTGQRLRLAAAAPGTGPAEIDVLELSSASYDDCVSALPGRTCVPVTHEGQLLAVLAIRVPSRVALPAAEWALIQDLARHAGLLVANARLAGDLAREVASISQQAAELLASRQLLVAAQDSERHRLERDIHDGAQQELVAALMQIRGLARRGDEPDRSGLAAVRTTVESARLTIEELCRAGRPAILDDAGLLVALESAVATARRTGLNVELTGAVPDRLPPDVETSLYFCCIEALQNSAKHARAASVTVTVEHLGSELILAVSDDGLGFEPTSSLIGSGTANLLDRMAAVGGAVSVRSAPGAGTAITFRVPVAESTRTGAPA